VRGGTTSSETQTGPPERSRGRGAGGFIVIRDDVEVPLAAWGSRRSRLLCKRLAAAAGEPVPREALFELLWPDDPDRSRLGARLSVQLSTVRRVLGGGVVADRDSVRLDLDAVSLDLARFGSAIAADRWGEAVAIHRGPFLPEDAYEPWAEPPRERARAAFVAALCTLADRASVEQDHATVIGLAQRLLETDPYDSSAHERLVEALEASGQHGEARQARHRYASRMHELGVVES
jgi:DNA-binding SARP family transcriptional activator